ncbi:hypothetical protein SASPL_147154 [Salvia splendens]|uniref:Serine-threonine/tyrosine-protein kinase catalytic domain-containing protein n=1 Tax=Salvia splendens TaxID=180675 RepID=A0A8X8WD54_SALSN|nr:hypothetical protein SASPL_147154 [Salvia splendens]
MRQTAFCRKDALAVMPTVKRKEEEESTSKLGIVLEVIGAIVAILGVLGMLIIVIYRRLQRKGHDEFRRHVPQPMRMASIGLPPYHNSMMFCVNYGKNVDEQLYKGRLRDGSVVLVKCLKLKQKHSPPQALQHHMEVISKLRHWHLVSVLGHCIVPPNWNLHR